MGAIAPAKLFTYEHQAPATACTTGAKAYKDIISHIKLNIMLLFEF